MFSSPCGEGDEGAGGGLTPSSELPLVVALAGPESFSFSRSWKLVPPAADTWDENENSDFFVDTKGLGAANDI